MKKGKKRVKIILIYSGEGGIRSREKTGRDITVIKKCRSSSRLEGKRIERIRATMAIRGMRKKKKGGKRIKSVSRRTDSS